MTILTHHDIDTELCGPPGNKKHNSQTQNQEPLTILISSSFI